MKKNSYIKFTEIYGTDLNLWPSNIKEAAFTELRSNAEFQNFLNSELAFERLIRDKKIEPQRLELVQDIIMRAARTPQQQKTSDNKFFAYLGLVSGRAFTVPLLSLIFVLFALFSFLLGFESPNSGESSFSQNDIIQKIFFDNGDYYE